MTGLLFLNGAHGELHGPGRNAVHQRRGDEADGQQRQQVGPQHIRIAQDTHAGGHKKTGHVGDEKIGFFFDVVGAKQLCGKQEEQQHHL